MTTVKPSKNLILSSKPRKQFPFWISSLPTILLSMIIGTYLDLYFVGKGLYSFPARPWPGIFTIPIPFTLLGMPILVTLFLYICPKLLRWNRYVLIILLALLMSFFERLAENFGFFEHHMNWNHSYSIVGYTLFFGIIYFFNQFITGKMTQHYQ